jgi:hypothetical protein
VVTFTGWCVNEIFSPFADNDVKMAEIFEIQQASQILGNRISGLQNPYFSDPTLKRAGAGTHT